MTSSIFGVDLDLLAAPIEKDIEIETEIISSTSSVNVDYRVIDVSTEGCLHQCVLPHGFKYIPLKPLSSEPARKYSFTLDYFQRQSIICIENQQSVLVSAHTSAGKTCVAEYAIAMCLSKKQRVVYTTPIKALSNQKFRDFQEIFVDVGLMTGDITINPDASVIIMTTEILRSMLYRGSDLTREIGWVIFDEIHYMREKSRGVVWEETIILLPDAVRLVFLSATIPNASQFAQWIVSLHKNPCHVVYTDYRPTPLQHYVFPCGGDGIFLVVNQQREFVAENFTKAINVISNCGDRAKNDSETRFLGSRQNSYCLQLVKLAIDRELDPLIVFSFSKRMCEYYAEQMNKIELTKDKEKSAIELIFNNAINSLSDEDKNLPQVKFILPMVKRGVGVHHGGLLPILKEIVEILFAEGYIKVLFATETFAMGLNMPARTVLFTGTSKFDGKSNRLISPGEYIQMSGRAGRRGKDKLGTVIMMMDNKIPPASAKNLLCGSADPLNSAFQLTNTMVLNLLRVEGLNPEYMLQKSFLQFQNYQSLPKYREDLVRIKDEIKLIPCPETFDLENDQENLNDYVNILEAIKTLESTKWTDIPRAKMMKYVQTGRIISINRDEMSQFGYGIILSQVPGVNKLYCLIMVDKSTPEPPTRRRKSLTSHDQPTDADLGIYPFDYVTPPPQYLDDESECCDNWKPVISVIPMKAITGITMVCLRIDQMINDSNGQDATGNSNPPPPSKKRKRDAKEKGEHITRKVCGLDEELKRHIYLSVNRAKAKLPDSQFPFVDPIKDLGVNDPKLVKIENKIMKLKSRLELNPLHQNPGLKDILSYHKKCSKKYAALANAVEKLRNCESVIQLDELIARKRLLRRMGFSLDDDSVALKGRIACELTSGDELLLAELLLDGLFSEMSPEQCAAVLSVFVNEATEKESAKLTHPPKTDLLKALNAIKDKAKMIGKCSEECRMAAGAIKQFETNISSNNNHPGNNNFISKILLESEELDYVKKFDGSLMEPVREWALGRPFIEVSKMTTQMEGSIVRSFRRLEELLRQMHCAAKVAGDTQLEDKFVRAMVLIKRDIVFANSLYLA